MLNFPIDQADTITDAAFLYRSLGSFWTDLFQEKGTIQGYSLGQAEEITQRYITLTEAINSYSVDQASIFHKEKWMPIMLLRSKLNQAPFLFSPNDAVFGVQPITSSYYAGETFQFGRPEIPAADVYEYYVGPKLSEFSVIADQVIAPGKIYVYGSDVILQKGRLIFNTNVFNDPAISVFNVYDDNGSPVTFTDANGILQQEQSMVLWVYNGQSDLSNLYGTFGYIFNLNKSSSQFFKNILSNLVKTFVNGPTVANLKKLLATITRVPFVLNATETVQQVFTENSIQYIVTDKEVYSVPQTYSLVPITVGQVLNGGDFLCKNIEYFDNTSGSSGWWKRSGLIDRHLSFSKYLFFGNYISQLSFSSEADLVTLDSSGNIVFPVIGEKDDVLRFNKYLNSNSIRKSTIKQKFNLVNPGDSNLIIPLDFVMDNFLKQNTAFFKINLGSYDQLAAALEYIPLLKSTLPPYVYFIIKLEASFPADTYSNLNGNILLFSGHHTNADGSNANGKLESFAPHYFNSSSSRLISISKGLLPQPFETITSPTSTTSSSAKMVSAKLRRTPRAGDSTAQFNKLLFLDFS